jgi:hypothetical protein
MKRIKGMRAKQNLPLSATVNQSGAAVPETRQAVERGF